MLQDGDTLTVADVMEVAGPDYDPRHIRRAFKSLHRRGKVCLTVKAGCLAVKVKSAPRSPAQGPVADALDASDTGAGQRGSAASRRLRSEVPMVAAPRSPAPMVAAPRSPARRVLRLLWRPLPLPGRFQSKDNAKSLTRPLNSAGKCHCRLPMPTRRRSPERLNGRKRRLYKVRDAQPFETYPQERHDANFAPVDLTTETQ